MRYTKPKRAAWPRAVKRELHVIAEQLREIKAELARIRSADYHSPFARLEDFLPALVGGGAILAALRATKGKKK